MPFAQNNGIKIHYQVTGIGPPLLLHHGRSGSSADWFDRKIVEALRDKNTLIIIDARGHGLSDKPHDPEEYKLEVMVRDVVAVLDDLGIKEAHYWGYSMGGRVGLGMAKYASDRLKSLIVGGASHHDREGPSPDLAFYQQDVETMISTIKNRFGEKWLPQIEDQIRTLDLEAMTAYCMRDGKYGLADSLPKLGIPCLLYVGEADPIINNVRESSLLIPGASFVTLPGVDHLSGWSRSDLVIPHIHSFLKEAESRGKNTIR